MAGSAICAALLTTYPFIASVDVCNHQDKDLSFSQFFFSFLGSHMITQASLKLKVYLLQLPSPGISDKGEPPCLDAVDIKTKPKTNRKVILRNSLNVSQADCELLILLPLSPECHD